MTTTAIKKQIHKAIDLVQNEPILKAIHLILDQEINQKREALRVFTEDEFYARNKESQKNIKEGKITVHKTVKAKFNRK